MNARAAMQNVCLIVCILVVQNRNAVGHAEEFQFLHFSDELRRLWAGIKPAFYARPSAQGEMLIRNFRGRLSKVAICLGIGAKCVNPAAFCASYEHAMVSDTSPIRVLHHLAQLHLLSERSSQASP